MCHCKQAKTKSNQKRTKPALNDWQPWKHQDVNLVNRSIKQTYWDISGCQLSTTCPGFALMSLMFAKLKTRSGCESYLSVTPEGRQACGVVACTSSNQKKDELRGCACVEIALVM